jgi:HD-GYP domain-containing protein (c-di-GMP phosphodiesterase class II)
MVYQHHERIDGSGYPLGISGDKIFLESRIVAVADTVEAMASNRPYRPAQGTAVALEEIKRLRGSALDAGVVDACLKLFEEQDFNFKLEESETFIDAHLV